MNRDRYFFLAGVGAALFHHESKAIQSASWFTLHGDPALHASMSYTRMNFPVAAAFGITINPTWARFMGRIEKKLAREAKGLRLQSCLQ
jgi:hypothetical protein